MTIAQSQLATNLWLVQAQGRIDQTLSPQLEQVLNELLANDQTRIIIDLSQATYINSGGLRCLVSGRRKAIQQGGDIVICSLTARLREVFEMTGFNQVFRVYETCEEAKEHPFV